jgi:hypothetical protein
VDTVDSVRVAGEQKKEEEERKSNTVVHLDMTTTITATDPWMLFLYAPKGASSSLWYAWHFVALLDCDIYWKLRNRLSHS